MKKVHDHNGVLIFYLFHTCWMSDCDLWKEDDRREAYASCELLHLWKIRLGLIWYETCLEEPGLWWVWFGSWWAENGSWVEDALPHELENSTAWRIFMNCFFISPAVVFRNETSWDHIHCDFRWWIDVFYSRRVFLMMFSAYDKWLLNLYLNFKNRLGDLKRVMRRSWEIFNLFRGHVRNIWLGLNPQAEETNQGFFLMVQAGYSCCRKPTQWERDYEILWNERKYSCRVFRFTPLSFL